jgi:nitroreductase
MNAHDAIMTRRSIRRFLPEPVPRASLMRILEGAATAPSGHNIQPWKVYAVAGAVKDRISAGILSAIANEPAAQHQPEFDYYPINWFEPFIGRRRKLGHELYAILGIAREDKAARERQMLENYKFFGAPVGLFVTFDRRLAAGTFMDVGMFIENILIGARGEGLDTYGQAAFNWYHKAIRKHLAMEDSELLACGISLGYADPNAPENKLMPEKLAVEQFTTFLGFEGS